MRSLRTFAGYVLLLLSVPLLALVFSNLDEEVKKTDSFHETLDKKIQLGRIDLPQAWSMTDTNGRTFAEYGHPYRIVLPGRSIPQFVKDLFIVSEDRHFYEHSGFDAAAISRAVMANARSADTGQGGSTITQQLVRNVYLTNEKTYNRKLTEVIYASKLEKTMTKEDILAAYLNTIYFQNDAYGVEAAARFYFQRSLNELNEAEMAFIAAIPNNPSLYNPLKHFDHTKARQERLLDQMAENGRLPKEKADALKLKPITLKTRDRLDLYPDYAAYAEAEIRLLIAQSEGNKLSTKQLEAKVKKVLASGIRVHTYLDPAIQERTVAAVKERLPHNGVEGSASVIDLSSRGITALSGGRQYKKYEFHRGFQAFRQPGSAIKPLLDYAPYIERFRASSDSYVNGGPFCSGNYCPKNYGGAVYGEVSLKQAFARSYNTPAVRLLDRTGMPFAFGKLHQFSFSRIRPEDERLPAAIGGFAEGVSVLELTDAYTSFENGTYRPARAVKKITDSSGRTLYEWKDAPKRVWSARTTAELRKLLAAAVQSGTATSASAPSRYLGGKTGTTNDYKDYWFIGLTDRHAAGVWVGYDRPHSMESIERMQPEIRVWNAIWK